MNDSNREPPESYAVLAERLLDEGRASIQASVLIALQTPNHHYSEPRRSTHL